MSAFKIGPFEFASQKAATERVSALLGKWDRQGLLSGDDEEFVAALLRAHPEAEWWTSQGVRGFVVQAVAAHRYKTRAFHVVTDNGPIEFSSRKAIHAAWKSGGQR